MSALDAPVKPLLIVVSGPSGAGKDAVLNLMKQSRFPVDFVTTLTTRPMRPAEKPDIDYHFVTEAQFRELQASKGLLESANVYGHWYGVPARPIREALGKGRDIIVKVDVQGAATIKKVAPQAVFIFVSPPSVAELVQRLKQRNTETRFDLEVRTRTAESEVRQLAIFDYLVINRQGELDRAVAQIEAIITAEKCRVKQREISI